MTSRISFPKCNNFILSAHPKDLSIQWYSLTNPSIPTNYNYRNKIFTRSSNPQSYINIPYHIHFHQLFYTTHLITPKHTKTWCLNHSLCKTSNKCQNYQQSNLREPYEKHFSHYRSLIRDMISQSEDVCVKGP